MLEIFPIVYKWVAFHSNINYTQNYSQKSHNPTTCTCIFQFFCPFMFFASIPDVFSQVLFLQKLDAHSLDAQFTRPLTDISFRLIALISASALSRPNPNDSHLESLHSTRVDMCSVMPLRRSSGCPEYLISL